MYSHLEIMEKDMLDSHISFQQLKRFKYMSLIPANQKLMTVAIIHHHCWITWDNVVNSCACLSDSSRTLFGVLLSLSAQNIEGCFFCMFHS